MPVRLLVRLRGLAADARQDRTLALVRGRRVNMLVTLVAAALASAPLPALPGGPSVGALAAWGMPAARPPEAPSFLQLAPLVPQHGVLEFNTKMGGNSGDFYSTWLTISQWHVILSLLAMLFWWAVITFTSKIFVMQTG